MRPNLLTRRGVLLGTAGVALAAHCGAPAVARSEPLRIGLLTSLSGPFTSLGESMRAGLELLIADAGGQMGGRPVELLVEDDGGKPEEGLRKVRKLIAQDGIDVLGGVISAGVALAIRDVVTEAGLPTFISNASANALAREAASPLVFRPTKTSWMLGHTGALWTFQNIAKDGGLTVGADYAAGREYIGDFVQTFQEQGGSVGTQLWTPLGTTDFSPILTTIAAEQPSFVYAFFAGADAVRFLQQMQEYQLQDLVKLIGPGALFDQEDVVPAAGSAALGGINTFQQSPTAPAAHGFVEAYRAARGRLPGEASTAGYVTGQVIRAGLEAVAGDPSDRERFRQALLEQPIETVIGPMRFDPRNNQAVLDIYVNELVAGPDGQPLNTVVHTYAGVQDPGPAG
ncbi:ABC transporter substrate-binding protein [Geminicoccus harenae]|uniref:ABC transporter substrate-binding protein n=1 Tax=Geminicoccus harenae TaxID=2498453 RepID=UPI001CC30A49|nr:ABC transporter substrate-binding protein [Geminicoccus harenae]